MRLLGRCYAVSKVFSVDCYVVHMGASMVYKVFYIIARMED